MTGPSARRGAGVPVMTGASARPGAGPAPKRGHRAPAPAGPARVAFVFGAAVLAASAVAHATGGGADRPLDGRDLVRPTIVAVGDAPAATGFSVGGGRVVTVAHVLEGPAVGVRAADGIARRATVVRRDDALDLAVLSAPGLNRGGPSAAPGVLVRRGDAVTALGATIVRRAEATVRAGDGRVLARRPVLELRVRIRAGDSGAPVLDARGRVLGVVFARSRERDDVAYAVDSRALARLLR